MKNIAFTLLLAGSVMTLAACSETTTSYDAGASYASGRTAGEVDGATRTYKKPAAKKAERVFKREMTK